MATADQIAQLRLLIAEPTAEVYSDVALGVVIDAEGSLDAAALEIWVQKAATAAELVDISEGGSQRKNSDLHKQALLMVDLFKSRVDSATANGRTKLARLSR